MNGDLSIPPTTTPNLIPRARPGALSAAHTVPAPGASQARTGAERGLDTARPAAAGQLEARRLKALLTDPAMRVSTHHDEASGHVVLRVHDQGTGEVIDQIPADKLLRLFADLRASLVDERA